VTIHLIYARREGAVTKHLFACFRADGSVAEVLEAYRAARPEMVAEWREGALWARRIDGWYELTIE
jgi:hypothetical protein